jgi:hypothetical protein
MNPIDILKIKVAVQKIHHEEDVIMDIFEVKNLDCMVLLITNCFKNNCWNYTSEFVRKLREMVGLDFKFPSVDEFKKIYYSEEFKPILNIMNLRYSFYLNKNTNVGFDKGKLYVIENPIYPLLTNSIVCVFDNRHKSEDIK